MERLLHASSGFGPVNTSRNVSLNPSSPRRNVSAVAPPPPEWNGYRDAVSTQSMIQNYSNFKSSGVPSRVIQWIDGAWVDVPSHALQRAKEAFESRVPMVEVVVDGNECMFDFFRMLLIDVTLGLQRSIAWIDVENRCFFPKFFVDESVVADADVADDDENSFFEIPKIEIEIKLDSYSNNNNNKRKAAVDDDDEDTAYSSSNSGAHVAGIRNKLVREAKRVCLETWPNVRLIGEEERSFGVVSDLFLGGMKKVDPRVKISSIRQFTRTGPIEKARWEAFHKQMKLTEESRGKANTVFAWFGADKKGVFNVLAHGFVCPAEVSGSGHGVGVYLSPARLPQISDELVEADEDGEKHLVLCRVILGNVEKVEAGSKQFYPSSVNFDNGVDDTVNPKWFVVWTTNMNTHILPECVVSYKCSDRQDVATQGSEQLQWIPNGPKPEAGKLFFSRLGSLLPPEKAGELKDLCMAFKAGNMKKDLFIKQLRSVVGNEMLNCAISGLQGSI